MVTSLDRLAAAFPAGFDFYGAGVVEPAGLPSKQQDFEVDDDAIAVAFNLYPHSDIGNDGDESRVGLEGRYFVLVFFGDVRQPSMYVEMGNTIASRIADHLNGMISPPQILNAGQIRRVAEMAGEKIHRPYHHHIQDGERGTSLPVDVYLLPVAGKEVAHV